MATTLVYNGVSIFGCRTLEFAQNAERDESGTDIVRHSFRITVEGSVHQWDGAPQWTDAGGSGGTSATRVIECQRRLLEDRKALDYNVDGESLVVADSGSDVNNGPKPVGLKIVGVYGKNLLKLQYTIDVALIRCESGDIARGVFNNRWSLEDDIDNNLYTVRTIRGRLRVNDGDFNPQEFRFLVLPSLSDGYRRDKMTFVTAPTGLELDYTITDKRTHAAAPFPASEWKATDTVTTASGYAFERLIHVWLKGPPTVDRIQLLGAAVAVIEAKLRKRLFDLPGGGGAVPMTPKQISFTDHLDDSIVEAMAHVEITPQPGLNDTTFFGMCKHLDGEINGYDHRKNLMPRNYAPDTPTSAFVMYVQSPCNSDHPVTAGCLSMEEQPGTRCGNSASGVGGQELGGGGGDSFDGAVVTYEGPLDNWEPLHSSSHLQSLYTFYRIRSRYITNHGKIALPVASPLEDTDSDTVRIIQVHHKTQKRIVYINAERVGSWPELPAPSDIDREGKRQTILEDEVLANSPEMAPDGIQLMYSLEAKYTYAITSPFKPGERLPIGSSPVDTTTIEDDTNTLSIIDSPGQSSKELI